ncbi:NINE protein [Lewinella sp. IMCC34183]|uniref:NINE protein n=1 Tax=Lewinella sp. IMCC34183 TaxID=2248762 RepID=UPI000E2816F4|nr:NINE protein [Lewinella sp. IMCC34183]
MLKKDLAGFLAFFLGIFGVHRFYLGQPFRGAVQFLGFWMIVAALAEEGPEMPLPFIMVGFVLAPLITAIVFWATPYERWAAKYDPEALVAQGYSYPKRSNRPTFQPGQTAPPSLRDLKAEGIKYYRAGDYDLASEAFQEALQQAPQDPVAHFNLACCFALQNQFPRALQALEVAVTYQLPRPERIEQHPALRHLRESAAYREFRRNNFRQLNLVERTDRPAHEQARADGPAADETVGDSDANYELLEQMARLRELHDSGILTALEYRTQREKLLG